MRRLAVAALLAAAGHAQAFEGVTSTFDGNLAKVEASRLARGQTMTPGSGGYVARVSGPVQFVGPGGRTAPGTLVINVGKAPALLAAAKYLRYAGHAGAAVAAASLAYELYDRIRIRPNSATDGRTGAGGLAWDPGTAPVGSSGAWYTGHGSCAGPAPLPVVECSVAAVHQTSAFHGCAFHSEGPTWWQGMCIWTATGGTTFYSVSKVEGQTQTCPPWIDPRTGVSAPGVVGLDGKCPTGQYTVPQTPEDAAGKAADWVTPDLLGDLYNVYRDTIYGDNPPDVRDVPKTQAPGVVTQEAESVGGITGPTTTTTDETGTTTEAIGWTFRRVEDDLRKNTGTWPETKTTTKTDPQGNPTGPPKVTTTNPTPTPGTAEAVDICAKNPDSVACSKLGDVPDSDLQQRSVEFNVTPMAGWGSGGACPAPPTVSIAGGSFTLDNSLVCTFLGALKWVLLAVAGVVAARIFIGGVES